MTTESASLPRAWRAALEALVRATMHEGHPWSCTGARVALTLEGTEGPARLSVTGADGSTLERTIDQPGDLVAVGKALLARPLAPASGNGAARGASAPAASRPASAPESSGDDPRAGLVAAPPGRAESSHDIASRRAAGALRSEPRLLVDALGSTRWSGSPAALWVGGVVRATLPFDVSAAGQAGASSSRVFSMGIWGRFEVAAVELGPVPADFTMTSGSVGLSLGYRLLSRPFELTAALDASGAIVSMDGGLDIAPLSAVGAKADFRLGNRLQGAVPFGARWRAIFAVDGEVGVMAATSARHRLIDPRLPPIPAFTLGASFGGELALR